MVKEMVTYDLNDAKKDDLCNKEGVFNIQLSRITNNKITNNKITNKE